MKSVLLSSLLSVFLFNTDIYSFKVSSIDDKHEQIDFSAFKGKKILIVNTACNSPYTFQLEGMQKLYNAYKEKLVVVAFPCDDFGEQELKTNSDIKFFCRSSYGLTFPISEKTNALGYLQHPMFAYLVDEAKKLGMDSPIKWNFTKFLLDENGQLMRVFPADVTPLSTEITSHLNNSRSWSLN